uniref:Uncharacterized protein MANES_01G177400 n=1 Tax=Rhizophora mucronata TaxID=61149 RepID=A0A2P2KF94_RHIMU
MADSKSAVWERIALSESCLVCSMCEEAVSLASSVLKQIRDGGFGGKTIEDIDEVHDMMESAGMVLVQSLNQLGRASQIVSELKVLFVSGAIPVQVLLSGVCFQIAEGSCVGVQEFLEEFLSNCRYLDGRCYVVGAGGDLNLLEGCDGGHNLELDQYIAVVEIYAVTLLAAAFKKVDLSIAWVEKAALPEEKRQVK